MKHTLLLLTLLISISLGLMADEKAKAILDKVSENTKSKTSITADFEFIMENIAAGIKESNNGNIIIQNDKYKLSISGIEIMSNGVSMWTYMPDAGEVSISDANNFEDDINPATIFTIYEHGFDYTFLGEAQRGNKRIFKIDLVPTVEREFSRVVLDIDQSNYQLVGAVMYGIDGNRYLIDILNYTTDKNYANSTFSFDSSKNPDVTVIDMR